MLSPDWLHDTNRCVLIYRNNNTMLSYRPPQTQIQSVRVQRKNVDHLCFLIYFFKRPWQLCVTVSTVTVIYYFIFFLYKYSFCVVLSSWIHHDAYSLWRALCVCDHIKSTISLFDHYPSFFVSRNCTRCVFIDWKQ